MRGCLRSPGPPKAAGDFLLVEKEPRTVMLLGVVCGRWCESGLSRFRPTLWAASPLPT